jgi:hypothetical protein
MNTKRRLCPEAFVAGDSTNGVNLPPLVDYLKQGWIKFEGFASGKPHEPEDFTVIPLVRDAEEKTPAKRDFE